MQVSCRLHQESFEPHNFYPNREKERESNIIWIYIATRYIHIRIRGNYVNPKSPEERNSKSYQTRHKHQNSRIVWNTEAVVKIALVSARKRHGSLRHLGVDTAFAQILFIIKWQSQTHPNDIFVNFQYIDTNILFTEYYIMFKLTLNSLMLLNTSSEEDSHRSRRKISFASLQSHRCQLSINFKGKQRPFRQYLEASFYFLYFLFFFVTVRFSH